MLDFPVELLKNGRRLSELWALFKYLMLPYTQCKRRTLSYVVALKKDRLVREVDASEDAMRIVAQRLVNDVAFKLLDNKYLTAAFVMNSGHVYFEGSGHGVAYSCIEKHTSENPLLSWEGPEAIEPELMRVSELIKADLDNATEALRQCVADIVALYRESDDMLADLDIDIQPTMCTAHGWLCHEDIRIEMKIQLSRCLPLHEKRKLEEEGRPCKRARCSC
jgi:hypothetical protein